MFNGLTAISISTCGVLIVICGIWWSVLLKGLMAYDKGEARKMPPARRLTQGIRLMAFDMITAGLAIIMIINHGSVRSQWLRYLVVAMLARVLYTIVSFAFNSVRGVRYPLTLIVNGAAHGLLVAAIATRLWQFSLGYEFVGLQRTLYHTSIGLSLGAFSALIVTIIINVVATRHHRQYADIVIEDHDYDRVNSP